MQISLDMVLSSLAKQAFKLVLQYQLMLLLVQQMHFLEVLLIAGQVFLVDQAITQLNGYRGDIGSTQNQVESAVRNLMTQSTNIKNAESVIRDVDYAEESANFNKLNIISQAGSYD